MGSCAKLKSILYFTKFYAGLFYPNADKWLLLKFEDHKVFGKLICTRALELRIIILDRKRLKTSFLFKTDLNNEECDVSNACQAHVN